MTTYRDPAPITPLPPPEEKKPSLPDLMRKAAEEARKKINHVSVLQKIKAYKVLPRVLKKCLAHIKYCASKGNRECCFGGEYDMPWFVNWNNDLRDILIEELKKQGFAASVSFSGDYAYIQW